MATTKSGVRGPAPPNYARVTDLLLSVVSDLNGAACGATTVPRAGGAAAAAASRASERLGADPAEDPFDLSATLAAMRYISADGEVLDYQGAIDSLAGETARTVALCVASATNEAAVESVGRFAADNGAVLVYEPGDMGDATAKDRASVMSVFGAAVLVAPAASRDDAVALVNAAFGDGSVDLDDACAFALAVLTQNEDGTIVAGADISASYAAPTGPSSETGEADESTKEDVNEDEGSTEPTETAPSGPEPERAFEPKRLLDAIELVSTHTGVHASAHVDRVRFALCFASAEDTAALDAVRAWAKAHRKIPVLVCDPNLPAIEEADAYERFRTDFFERGMPASCALAMGPRARLREVVRAAMPDLAAFWPADDAKVAPCPLTFVVVTHPPPGSTAAPTVGENLASALDGTGYATIAKLEARKATLDRVIGEMNDTVNDTGCTVVADGQWFTKAALRAELARFAKANPTHRTIVLVCEGDTAPTASTDELPANVTLVHVTDEDRATVCVALDCRAGVDTITIVQRKKNGKKAESEKAQGSSEGEDIDLDTAAGTEDDFDATVNIATSKDGETIIADIVEAEPDITPYARSLEDALRGTTEGLYVDLAADADAEGVAFERVVRADTRKCVLFGLLFDSYEDIRNRVESGHSPLTNDLEAWSRDARAAVPGFSVIVCPTDAKSAPPLRRRASPPAPLSRVRGERESVEDAVVLSDRLEGFYAPPTDDRAPEYILQAANERIAESNKPAIDGPTLAIVVLNAATGRMDIVRVSRLTDRNRTAKPARPLRLTKLLYTMLSGLPLVEPATAGWRPSEWNGVVMPKTEPRRTLVLYFAPLSLDDQAREWCGPLTRALAEAYTKEQKSTDDVAIIQCNTSEWDGTQALDQSMPWPVVDDFTHAGTPGASSVLRAVCMALCSAVSGVYELPPPSVCVLRRDTAKRYVPIPLAFASQMRGVENTAPLFSNIFLAPSVPAPPSAGASPASADIEDEEDFVVAISPDDARDDDF
jgi:hypothetical protein